LFSSPIPPFTRLQATIRKTFSAFSRANLVSPIAWVSRFVMMSLQQSLSFQLFKSRPVSLLHEPWLKKKHGNFVTASMPLRKRVVQEEISGSVFSTVGRAAHCPPRQIEFHVFIYSNALGALLNAQWINVSPLADQVVR
jgi:hypothetical protein